MTDWWYGMVWYGGPESEHVVQLNRGRKKEESLCEYLLNSIQFSTYGFCTWSRVILCGYSLS